MSNYRVKVAMDRNMVVLEARGHLDVSAGRHIVEMARLVVERLERPVQIDLGGVRSSTPGGASLVAPRRLRTLPGMISVRRAQPRHRAN